MQFWISKEKMMKGGKINCEVMEKRKNKAEIIDKTMIIEQVKEKSSS